MINMKRIVFLFSAVVILGMMIFSLNRPSIVSGQAALPTPTALPDGRIIYIAQPGDSWWIISVKTGVTEQQLYLLNNAKPDDPLLEGQKILLGNVTPNPPTATLNPNITPTPTPLTPTPLPGNGIVCVVLYEDVNGNSTREDTETPIADGAISLTAASGKPSLTGKTTNGTTPFCFNDVPEGQYSISVAVPEGYNPTTSMNCTLPLKAGDNSTLDFGAQLSSKAQPQSPSQGGRSPVLGIVGGVLIIGALGLGIYILRFHK